MFCVRGFGGGVGVSLFFGGCSGLSVVFSRASGVSWFLACSAPDCWGGWRVAGGSGVRGLVRPGGSSSLIVGGAGSGARVARFPWWGSGCARFPVRVRGVVVVFAGGFRVLFFSVRRSLFSSGFRCWSSWSCRGWGVVGGVGLGSGFFLRLLLYWPGPVWVWVGFCLESLILAQDERWRRA